MEIALKMAFRAFMAQHPQQDASRLEVVGIAEGYHGDTLGCMDAVAPSVYNGPRQTPWSAVNIHCTHQCDMPASIKLECRFPPEPLAWLTGFQPGSLYEC